MAIFVPLDTSRFDCFDEPLELEVAFDSPCRVCSGSDADCLKCAGMGFVSKANHLALPALATKPIGYWLRFPAAGPSAGPENEADLVVVLVEKPGVYEATVSVARPILQRGGTIRASISTRPPCGSCRGLSAIALPSGAQVCLSELTLDPAHGKLTCTIGRDVAFHNPWCDECFCSGKGKPVTVEAHVTVPAGTAPGEPFQARSVRGPDDAVLGDLRITFQLDATQARAGSGSDDHVVRGPVPRPAGGPSLGGIVLPPDVEQQMLRAIAMFKANDPAMPRGLLLAGPPGTGKTLLAKSIATIAESEFFAVAISDLKGSHIGESAGAVRALWEKASAAKRAVIFIDECEGAFPRRASVASDRGTDEIVEAFLAAWDGFESPKTVWVIGATNRPELLDDAIVSRFGETISLGLPGPDARCRILEREFEAMRVPLIVDEELVAETDGLSGRDLAKIAQLVRQETFPEPPTREALSHVLRKLRKRTSTAVDAFATWETLVLDEELERRLQTMTRMLKDAQTLKDQGVALPSTLLLEGPPGTGKTQIARTLANESGLKFIGVTTADLKAKYVGQSGHLIQDAFNGARAQAPCILFIDEIDAIAGARGGEDDLVTEMVGQLLQELDGIKENDSPVFVVAATNRAEAIDPGILSRFAQRMRILLPNVKQRAEILKVRLAKLPCDFPVTEVALEIAKQLEGASGRDLKSLLEKAGESATARAYSSGDVRGITLKRSDLEDVVKAERRETSTVVDRTATWDRLVLDQALKDELRVICEMLKSAAELERDGIVVPSSLLLEGPPGTGKTQIARTLASESGLKFIGVTTSDFKAKYLGQSGHRVRDVFNEARTKSPCILFIDEIDAVAGARGGEDGLMTEMVGQLLQEMDGLKETESHVLVVAATNRRADIDPGILSRFSRTLYIGLPNAEQRAKLLALLLDRVPISFDRDLVYRDLAEKLDGASGRDLKSVVEVAERHAMTRVLGARGKHRILLDASDLEAAATEAGFNRG